MACCGTYPMTLHREVHFEDEICADLTAAGWLQANGDAAAYDRARALFPADLVAWVQATQPAAWAALSKNHGAAAEATLLDRLRKSLDDRGTLDVLRHGVELLGLRQPLALAQFKPALAMNPDTLARYAANRLRVVRQLRYSLHHENAIDLVLFLNGPPVATAELKSEPVPWVFPATDRAEPVCIKSFGKQLADRQREPEARMSNRTKATLALALPGGKWTAHDLRRTAATLMARLGVSTDAIDECLNHKLQSKVARVYIRDRRQAEQARAFDALGRRLTELFEGREGAQMLPFKAA